MTYPANEPSTVWKISKTKKPIEIGGLGNQYTIKVAKSASISRGQNAIIQGRRGLLPLDHRPAIHPANIWKGKSMRTAIARSSRPRPFSTILSWLTASLAAQPIFANKWRMQRVWTSESYHETTMFKDPEKTVTNHIRFSLQIFHIVTYTLLMLRSSSSDSLS